MTTIEADRETTAFLTMAHQLRRALSEREAFIRLFRERYDRSEDDPRKTSSQRVRCAADLLRAAQKADSVYDERVEGALSEYRDLISTEQETRY